MIRVVCCYCKKQVKTKPSDTDAVSHGVCDQCLPLMVRELGQPMQEYLDELRPPVLVVQDNARVIAANAAARKMLTKEQLEICGELAGEVIGCMHAREPGGCGQTVHCKGCAVRRSVAHTHATGEALYGVHAYQDILTPNGIRTAWFELTTERAGDLVLLRIDDVGVERPA